MEAINKFEPMDTAGKTRIKTPGRSAGDGMENSSFSEFESKSWASNQQQASFTNLHTRNFALPPAKLKGPKFVPYEPYRAAVSPILKTSYRQEKTSASNFVIDSQKVSSLASSIIELYSNLEKRDNSLNVLNNAEDKKCNFDCCSKIKALEDKIKLLEKENKELASQHQVQIEVNADLKKMLVASLGEDVQCKVQYMTEDKAHLGKEVLLLSEELEQSKEEIEKLSVQCNVWESKFKASSLMVKELANWKASLSHKLNDSVTALDSVLKEHDVLFENLYTTQSILDQTLNAFDPSAKQLPRKQDLSPSVLKLAMELKSLAINIQERLLGISPCDKISFNGVRQLTRAENLVNQLFEKFDTLSPAKEVALMEGKHFNAGLIACQVLPHICPKDLNISYCKHCSGEVEII